MSYKVLLNTKRQSSEVTLNDYRDSHYATNTVFAGLYYSALAKPKLKISFDQSDQEEYVMMHHDTSYPQ